MTMQQILSRTFAALLFLRTCAALSGESYNFILLGDLHYDETDLHDLSAFSGSPSPTMQFLSKQSQNRHGLFSWRDNTMWLSRDKLISVPKNIPLNAKAWEKTMPDLLDEAAAAARRDQSVCAIQLGDLVHGDAGRYDLHRKMIANGLATLTSRFACPVLTVIGNHDSRGPEGERAWNDVIFPHLDKTGMANLHRKHSNYYFTIGKDLFYCHDLFYPDPEFLRQALAEFPGARYFFFVTHVPVLPANKNWIFNILTDYPEEILSVLEKHQAIVLCGHKHDIMLGTYIGPSGKIVTQFEMHSTMRNPKYHGPFVRQVIAKKENPMSDAQRKLWNKLFEGRVKNEIYTNGSGYSVVRVGDDGVFADFFNFREKKPHVLKLR